MPLKIVTVEKDENNIWQFVEQSRVEHWKNIGETVIDVFVDIES